MDDFPLAFYTRDYLVLHPVDEYLVESTVRSLGIRQLQLETEALKASRRDSPERTILGVLNFN